MVNLIVPPIRVGSIPDLVHESKVEAANAGNHSLTPIQYSRRHMETPRGNVRTPQKEFIGGSHVAKENGIVRVSEEQKSLPEDEGSAETSFSPTANGSAIDRTLDISTDSPRVEGTAKAATEPIPETGDVASVLSADETAPSTAPKKTQSVEHISWMERRIGTLEEELRSLRTETL